MNIIKFQKFVLENYNMSVCEKPCMYVGVSIMYK